MKGKKGNLEDIIFIIVSCMIGTIFLIVGFMLWTNWSAKFVEMGLNTTAASNNVIARTTAMFGPADYLIIALLIGMYLGMLISAFYIRVHAVFVVLFIVLSLLILFISAIISNVYESFTTSSVIADYAMQFPKTNFIFSNLVYISLAMIVGGIIVIYAKPQALSNV